MTKGTKTFRIIICVLLALTMICTAFLTALFIECFSDGVMDVQYGIYVDGVSVTIFNKDDILGDGKVYYNNHNNTLTFNNATIETDNTVLYSRVDLIVELIGENKFICKNEVYSLGVYAGDNYLGKDLNFVGDGSLTVELPIKSGEAAGIYASDLTVSADVNVKISDCENKVHGIVCDSNLLVVNKAKVTVDNGAANNSVAVRVRGNALFEEGTTLNATVNPGTAEICKGLNVSGDVFLGKDTSLNVSVDDASASLGDCIRVSGLMEVGVGSNVTASSKKAPAIACFGSIEANKDAVISAATEKQNVDILCSGALVNYGAQIDGNIDAVGGTRNIDKS